MKTPILVASAALLLAGCGSNVPPPSADQQGGSHDMSGVAMPAPTGNQDRDFAQALIAHHQGAIDMARVQQARGKDPALRQLAGKIIAEQQAEIAVLNAFLDRTGGR